MKSHLSLLPSVLALSLAALSAGQAAVVFSDDFSEADGTPILGKSPDVGGAWTGNAPDLSGGSFDTTGAARAAFATFTTALQAGQKLTLTFDSLAISGTLFSGGYAGVSLFAGGNERAFIGDLNVDTVWGVDQAAVGGAQVSADASVVTSVTFTYLYDTGAWTFTTTTGANLSGFGSVGEGFDNLRIANDGGGDIRVDNLVVDISAVPEPATLALAGLAGLSLLRRRR